MSGAEAALPVRRRRVVVRAEPPKRVERGQILVPHAIEEGDLIVLVAAVDDGFAVHHLLGVQLRRRLTRLVVVRRVHGR